MQSKIFYMCVCVCVCIHLKLRNSWQKLLSFSSIFHFRILFAYINLIALFVLLFLLFSLIFSTIKFSMKCWKKNRRNCYDYYTNCEAHYYFLPLERKQNKKNVKKMLKVLSISVILSMLNIFYLWFFSFCFIIII